MRGCLIKVIEVDKIKIASVNQKYNANFILNPAYRDFKTHLTFLCERCVIKAPYKVTIELEMYQDIDNPVKCILDSLGNAIDNDRNILELHVFKTPIKRGRDGSVKVFVESINE